MESALFTRKELLCSGSFDCTFSGVCFLYGGVEWGTIYLFSILSTVSSSFSAMLGKRPKGPSVKFLVSSGVRRMFCLCMFK